MKIKDGVILSGLDMSMRKVLIGADHIWNSLGQELVVTSGLDGVHSSSSYHYYGRALDFRISYFSNDERKLAAIMLRHDLGDDYDVVLHSTHIHVEYDPVR